MNTRPLKYSTYKEIQKDIDNYFDKCDKKNKPYTITGLSLALDTCRETLLTYQNCEQSTIDKVEASMISDAIVKAKQRCQNYAEEYLFSGKPVAGSIFNLCNNYKWKNGTDLNIGGQSDNKLNISVSFEIEPDNKKE